MRNLLWLLLGFLAPFGCSPRSDEAEVSTDSGSVDETDDPAPTDTAGDSDTPDGATDTDGATDSDHATDTDADAPTDTDLSGDTDVSGCKPPDPSKSQLLQQVPRGPELAGYDTVDGERQWAVRIGAGFSAIDAFAVYRLAEYPHQGIRFEVHADAAGAPAADPLPAATVDLPDDAVVDTDGYITAHFPTAVPVACQPVWLVLLPRTSDGTFTWQSTIIDHGGETSFLDEGSTWTVYAKPYAMPHRLWGDPG
jgi:hypothetical protein